MRLADVVEVELDRFKKAGVEVFGQARSLNLMPRMFRLLEAMNRG